MAHEAREISPDTETADRPKTETFRLSVNMNPETARLLREHAASKGLSYTEAVRRAIAIWAFVEDEVAAHHRVQSVDPDEGIIRELVLA